jgi:hypothetical protein
LIDKPLGRAGEILIEFAATSEMMLGDWLTEAPREIVHWVVP